MIEKKEIKIKYKKSSYIVLINKKVFLRLPLIKSNKENISSRTYTYLVLLKILRNFGLVKSLTNI